jgi:hypothetical protein
MKIILAILLLCLSIDTIQAQTIIEKHLSDASNKKVKMDIQIADSIRIITWSKPEVYIKASVNLNDNKNNDNYKTSFDESGTAILIKSKIEFEKGKNCCGTSTNCNCNCNCNSKIYWDVYIPENTDFSVETINGNIVISGKTSDIRAHTISGYVDLTVAPTLKTDLKMNTISGTMYSNFELTAESKSLRHVGGGSINTQLNGGGGKSIDLETISGDIFFRKAE